MGYTSEPIHLHATLERHNGPGDIRDNEALERFKDELRMLIQADPDYERIFREYRRYPRDF